MNRRTLATLTVSFLSMAVFLPHAGARSITKPNGLHADLSGPRASGGSVDIVRGVTGFLKAQVWNLPSPDARLQLGDLSLPLPIDPETGLGTLLLDGRVGQRLPTLKEGSIVAVTVRGQVVMKGELTAR
jgi:hypothetical protein